MNNIENAKQHCLAFLLLLIYTIILFNLSTKNLKEKVIKIIITIYSNQSQLTTEKTITPTQYEQRLIGFIDSLGFKQHTELAQKNAIV